MKNGGDRTTHTWCVVPRGTKVVRAPATSDKGMPSAGYVVLRGLIWVGQDLSTWLPAEHSEPTNLVLARPMGLGFINGAKGGGWSIGPCIFWRVPMPTGSSKTYSDGF